MKNGSDLAAYYADSQEDPYVYIPAEALFTRAEDVRFFKFDATRKHWFDKLDENRLEAVDPSLLDMKSSRFVGLSQHLVLVYDIAEAKDFFRSLLQDTDVLINKPFLKNSWAFLTHDMDTILGGFRGCIVYLKQFPDIFDDFFSDIYERKKHRYETLWNENGRSFPSKEALLRDAELIE